MKSMGLGLSLLYFGIPAVVLAAGFYLLMPWLINCGMLPYYAYSLGLGLPLLAMLVASIVAYRLEGNPFKWSALMARFNYRPLSLRDLLIVAGIFAVELALYFLMTRFTGWLIGQGLITLPSNLPAFINPQTVWTQETINAATGGLPGNWFLLFFSLVLLIINVVGEEFWWRGIVLPRQQLALAGCTLLVHALLWTFFHGFKYWDLLNLLPLSFGLTFAVLYLKNSSAGLVMHFISNGVGLVPILLGVLEK
ncbi:MAG: CPBP family intramembrane metalloprotease [Anaerolineae bacterium]|nr:CPBP family intramembrane metalloprotease [Anaerolineae bacterium]